jgi:hypothetical protein
MSPVEATDAIAAYGQTFIRFLVAADWREARAAKGPTASSSLDRDRQAINKVEEPWRGERRLRLTLAPDVQASSREVSRLAALARIGLVEMDASPGVDPLPLEVGRLEWRVKGWTVIQVETTRLPGSVWGTSAGSPDWEGFAASFYGLPKGRPGASDYDLTRLAHEALENDMFVTTNANALARRYDHSMLWRCGVFSPRESVETVELWLRTQREFPVIAEEGFTGRDDAVIAYGRLTRVRLAPVVTALRSVLSPTTNDPRRRAVRPFLLDVLTRHRQLLMAHDALARIAHQERWMYGGNNLLADQLYHLQNSLILLSGILDNVAWVIARLDGQDPSAAQVSWRKMTRHEPSWVKKLEATEAVELLRAARACRTPLLDCVFALRDLVQHRTLMVAGTAEWRDGHGVKRACMGAIELTSSLSNHTADALAALPGAIVAGPSVLGLPHSFQRAALEECEKVLAECFNPFDWPDAGWWRQDSGRMPDQDRLDEEAGWLFSPRPT